MVGNFLDPMQPFCEGQLWDREYVSAATALFLVFIGGYGLWFNQVLDPYTRHFFSWFLINGFASFGFHMSLTRGFDAFDKWSMVIVAYLGASYAVDGTISYFLVIKPKANGKTARRDIIAGLVSVVFNILMLITVVFDSVVQSEPAVFSALFAFPVLVVVVCGLVLFYDEPPGWVYFDSRFVDVIRRLYIRGCVVGVIGATIWQVIENTCNVFPASRYLFGHALWHVIFGYAMYCIEISMIATVILFRAFDDTDADTRKVHVVESFRQAPADASRFRKAWHTIFPSLVGGPHGTTPLAEMIAVPIPDTDTT